MPTPTTITPTPPFLLPPPPPPPLPPNSGLHFRQKLLYLENSLGVDPTRALSLNPSLRSAPLSSLHSLSSFLSSFSLLPSDLSRILSLHPHLLTLDPHLHLLPVLLFLLGPVALPFPHLRLALSRCPRLLLSSVPQTLAPALRFLRSLGFVGRHRIDAHTSLLLASSVPLTLAPKLHFFRDALALSHRDARTLLLRCPRLFTYSVEGNLRPKVEFLCGEMGRDLGEVRDFPQFFAFSLEGRIRPRDRMLREWGLEMSLADMLKVSDGEFRSRLVEMKLGNTSLSL